MASNEYADDGSGVAPAPELRDLDEWTEHQRLRAIYQARQRATEELEEASKYADFYQGAERRVLLVRAFRGVQSYLYELEPLFFTDDGGERMVREEAEPYWRDELLGKQPLPGPHDTVVYVGLKDVFGRDAQRTVRWEETVVDAIDGEIEQVREETVAVPLKVSVNAFRCANRFLADVGYEADPDAGELPHDKI